MQFSAWKVRLVIGYTGVATGLCFLLVAASLGIYEAIFLSRSLTSQGTVTANLQSVNNLDSSSGTVDPATFCPQFQYLSEGGIAHTVTGSACASPPAFAVGEKVRVHYLRSHPEKGQIDSFGAKWGLPLGFGIGCVVLLPIGIFLLRKLRAQGHSLDLIGFWE